MIPRPVRVSLFWPMQQIFGRFVTVDETGAVGGGGEEGLSILAVFEGRCGLSVYPDRSEL